MTRREPVSYSVFKKNPDDANDNSNINCSSNGGGSCSCTDPYERLRECVWGGGGGGGGRGGRGVCGMNECLTSE